MGDLDAYLGLVARKLRPGGRLMALENERGPAVLRLARMIRHRRLTIGSFHFFDSNRWSVVRSRFAPILEQHVRWPPVGAFVGELREEA